MSGPPGSARGKYRLVAAGDTYAQALRGRAEQQPCQTSGASSAAFRIAGLAGRAREATPRSGVVRVTLGHVLHAKLAGMYSFHPTLFRAQRMHGPQGMHD